MLKTALERGQDACAVAREIPSLPLRQGEAAAECYGGRDLAMLQIPALGIRGKRSAGAFGRKNGAVFEAGSSERIDSEPRRSLKGRRSS